MSKRKPGKRTRLTASAKGSRRRITTIVVMLALIAAGITTASWSVIKSRSAEPQSQPSLAKEYIYAGGRLVATEEPPGTTLSPPTGLVATATSTTQVSLSWTAPTQSTVDHYEVWRTQSVGQPYSHLSPDPTSTDFTDSGVTGGITYLYKVRAVGPEGNFSDYSDIDLATTIVFTDDPLIAAVTAIKAQHLTELRQSVNAVRATANLQPASWTDSSAQGVVVKAVHISELRSNLNAALSTLGFSAPPYTDPTLVPGTTVVKKVHVEELRQRMK